jgi:hypothetical protein
LLIAVATALSLASCASYDGRSLIPGKSTDAEVEALMGPSADRRSGPNGETVRYYSRLPFGRVIFAARFGPDGRLKALEQRLIEDNFERLKSGVSRADDVRELLGPPYRVEQFPRMQREIWTYQWQGLTSDRLLLVQFSADGIIREVYKIEDPDSIGHEGDGP